MENTDMVGEEGEGEQGGGSCRKEEKVMMKKVNREKNRAKSMVEEGS